MSHFTVLIIGNNPEEQLAPFQENNMDDCPSEYLEFYDMEDEMLKKWEDSNNTITQYFMDDKYQSPYNKSVSEEAECRGIKKQNYPVKTVYPTFKEYAEDYYGYEKRDPLKGRYGYWQNPNAKWDWYTIGGCWTGFFKLKPEVMENKDFEKIAIGSPGLMTEPAKIGYCDQCTKDQLDLDSMRDEAQAKVEKAYDKFEIAVTGIDLTTHITWEDMREKHENIDDARKEYRNQPVLQAMQKAEIGLFWNTPEDVYYLNKGGREAAIQNARNTVGNTFAVIKDGKWYEKGSMGWWGIVTDENDNWNKEFSKLLDSLPGDTLLTVVDCHI